MNIYALNPQRVAKLGSEISRTNMLGNAAAWPGLYQHINAAHEAVTTLAGYLTQLHAVPNGITSDAEKLALSWKASQAASPVLKAARKRIEQEAKDMAQEAAAEASAFWNSKLPDTATRLRAMEVLERYVAKGQLENLSALMQDAGVAAVMATTNRRLIHESLSEVYRDSITRGALKNLQPDIIAKADKAEELLELASGYSEAIKIVDHAVSSATAAAAWESRVQPPVWPEAVPA